MGDIFYFVKQIHLSTGKKLYINMFASTLIGLLEGVGIFLLILMISMSGIVRMDTGEIPLLNFVRFFENIPATIGLPLILMIYIIIAIGQNLLHRYISIQNTIIQHSFFRHMRVTTYDGLLHANWDFFIKRRKSDLINIMTGEISRAGAGAYSFLEFISSLIFACVQIGLAFWLSPNITLFVLLFGLGLVYFNRKFLKRSLALGNINYELGKSYLAGLTDQMNGIKDIKSNTLERSRMDWYRSITKEMKNQQIDYTKLKTKSQMYYKIASTSLIALFIFIAITLFNAQGGQLMLIILIFARLWPSVAGIQGSLEQIATILPSFKAVKQLQSESKKAIEFEKREDLFGGRMQIEKGIECHGVSFRYNKNQPIYALQNISIDIPSNQMTAIVGKSGAGKSTLIDILMGLNKPQKGQVLVDGIPLASESLLAWRNSISYVPQDPFLFNTTVRENLILVEENANEEQLWEALEFSSAAEFVRNLPEGLDTMIGDRGIKLSGGERQRLVLARAILRKPSILILDEATSSLDTENERRIQEALERLKGKMTLVVIAHRLTTIRHADQVIVLDKGKVVQKGQFSQLSQEKRTIFSSLLTNQLKVTQ